MPRFLVGLGAALSTIATVVGVVNAFTMSDMPAMHGPGGDLTLHGMPLSEMPEMWFAAAGMVVVLVGACLSARPVTVPAEAASTSVRWKVVAVATVGLAIDTSKTSTLGFVIPGMRVEYGVSAAAGSLLAVAGLTGTAVGAVVFGQLSDRIGRRRTYLIGVLGFTVTSMCGSMPTFTGNVVMCALMGIAVGGLAPLLITLLADEFGARRRAHVIGLSIVATAVGYLVASGSAYWLEPVFGWRVLWLIGAPTGIALLVFAGWIPSRAAPPPEPAPPVLDVGVLSRNTLRVYAFLVGVMTFALTTWLPTLARSGGVSVQDANFLLTMTAVVMVPCALLAMVGYRRIGPIGLLVILATVTAVVLVAITLSGAVGSVQWLSTGALAGALFAVNTMTAVLLPVSAGLAPPAHRGRSTGSISLFNRIGALCGPLLLAGLVSSTAHVLVVVTVMAVASATVAGAIAVRRYQWRSRPAPDLETAGAGSQRD